jgi:hypothetical protein
LRPQLADSNPILLVCGVEREEAEGLLRSLEINGAMLLASARENVPSEESVIETLKYKPFDFKEAKITPVQVKNEGEFAFQIEVQTVGEPQQYRSEVRGWLSEKIPEFLQPFRESLLKAVERVRLSTSVARLLAEKLAIGHKTPAIGHKTFFGFAKELKRATEDFLREHDLKGGVEIHFDLERWDVQIGELIPDSNYDEFTVESHTG